MNGTRFGLADDGEQGSWGSSPMDGGAGSPPMHFAMDDELLEGARSSSTPGVAIPGTQSDEMSSLDARMSTLMGTNMAGSVNSSFGSYPKIASLRSLAGSLDRSKEEFLNSGSSLLSDSEEDPIHKIVITGGPCSGKTTAIARLRGYLLDNGMRVFTVPDAAALLFANGASFEDLGGSRAKVEFQVQVHLERTFRDLARATRVPCIIICDKGLMDGMCYVSDDEWRAVLERCKLSTVEARDQRYTACFHMMTAADGAEAFYHENVERVGAARPGQGYPSIEEAREFDERCQSAWTGHPRFTVISNAGEIDFEGKLHNLICAVAQHVGIEVPREKKFRKYLLTREPTVEDFEGEEIPVEHFEVEKVFLAQNKSQRERGISSFVRRRSQGSHASYTRTNSVSSSTGETIEMKKIITASEYAENVAERADLSRRTVRQHRMAFLYDNTHHEIYVYKKPCQGLSLLLVQVFSDDANPLLPPFLPVAAEVTGRNEYSAYQLSVCQAGDTPHEAKEGFETLSPRSVPLPGLGDDGKFLGDDFAGDDFAL